MIVNLIMYKNTVIGAFTSPTFTDLEPKKAAEQIARSIQLQADAQQFDKVKLYRNLEMYFMGSFDDRTGKFDLVEPELILDCTEIVRPLLDQYYETLKEGVKDGGN